jgi:SAM-dependent methyltransferase
MSKTEAVQRCRFCSTPLVHSFADLGATPVSNAFRKLSQRTDAEAFYPLRAFVCENCKLVQLQDFQSPEQLFTEEYAYFSSYSESWLRHAAAYVDMMIGRFGFGADQLVIEVASNDGYLLQYFKARGVSVLGVDPSANVAAVAERERGIPTLVRFFGRETAADLRNAGRMADLMLGNNVLAHVPDINDFVAGFKILLKPEGVITFEFPHLLRLIENNQFDTIYHEHYSYLSLTAVERILGAHGLAVFDIEQLATHGGSLRIFASHVEAGRSASQGLVELRAAERAFGLESLAAYADFSERVRRTKRLLLRFLIDAKEVGKTIVGYGAPAKGNTLLNYCGVSTDFIDYTVDRSPYKQGLFLPGTGIPIHAPERIRETRPDYVLILPWNLKDEVIEQMADIREWGGRFVVPIPEVEIIP